MPFQVAIKQRHRWDTNTKLKLSISNSNTFVKSIKASELMNLCIEKPFTLKPRWTEFLFWWLCEEKVSTTLLIKSKGGELYSPENVQFTWYKFHKFLKLYLIGNFSTAKLKFSFRNISFAKLIKIWENRWKIFLYLKWQNFLLCFLKLVPFKIFSEL